MENHDKTFEVANEILRENRDKEITVIDQKSKEGPGVLEAFDISKYETIAILDSDISVNPETLNDLGQLRMVMQILLMNSLYIKWKKVQCVNLIASAIFFSILFL